MKLFNDGESYVKTIRIGYDTSVINSIPQRFKDRDYKIVLKKYRDGGSDKKFRSNIIFDSFEVDSSIPRYKDDVLHFDEYTISYVYDKFIALKKETLAGDSVIKYFLAKREVYDELVKEIVNFFVIETDIKIKFEAKSAKSIFKSFVEDLEKIIEIVKEKEENRLFFDSYLDIIGKAETILEFLSTSKIIDIYDPLYDDISYRLAHLADIIPYEFRKNKR